MIVSVHDLHVTGQLGFVRTYDDAGVPDHLYVCLMAAGTTPFGRAGRKPTKKDDSGKNRPGPGVPRS